MTASLHKNDQQTKFGTPIKSVSATTENEVIVYKASGSPPLLGEASLTANPFSQRGEPVAVSKQARTTPYFAETGCPDVEAKLSSNNDEEPEEVATIVQPAGQDPETVNEDG